MSFDTDHPFVLTATCESRMGTTARVTTFLASRRFYIVEMQQFDDTIGIHPTAAEEFVTMRTPVQS